MSIIQKSSDSQIHWGEFYLFTDDAVMSIREPIVSDLGKSIRVYIEPGVSVTLETNATVAGSLVGKTSITLVCQAFAGRSEGGGKIVVC